MNELGALADATTRAPTAPGVYYFLDARNTLLYVGKATNLRKRLQQHTREPAATRGLRIRYALVENVRWEVTADEQAAVAREADVIVALRPPCNACTDEGRWQFIVTEEATHGTVHVHLTTSPTANKTPTYGCFPHLGRGVSLRPGVACSDGYAAFLRLLWAASGDGDRVPHALTRTAPPDATIRVDDRLRAHVHAFLSGTSDKLLGVLADLAERHRDAYMQPALRRDAQQAAAFFTYGPRAIRALRLRHRLPPQPLTRDAIESLLTTEVTAVIGTP